MKYLIIFYALVFYSSSLVSQSFELDTILYNGDENSYINIVILSDGYQESELDKFVSDATNASDALFAKDPFKQYINYFNVFAIKVPSNESGANHPGNASDVTEPKHPVKNVDNYFGSSFDAFGIHRLLVPGSSNKIFNVLASNFPLYDQVIVLVNSPYYGGSGGVFATSSLHESANEIVIHEIGHSFASLIDEYYAGDQYAREGINMTGTTEISNVKWKNWIDYKNVGVYQHCCSGDSKMWYRPHEDCLMRYLGKPFCPVCIEGIIENIHIILSPLKGFYPETKDVFVGQDPLVFNVDLIKPDPNTLILEWSLNGEVIGEGEDSMTVNLDELLDGLNELVLTIEDKTSLLRVDGHDEIHKEFVFWEINTSVSGIENVSVNGKRIKIDIYPNPTQDYISFRTKESVDKPVIVQLFDTNGNLIKTSEASLKEEQIFDIKDVVPGNYMLRIMMGKKMLGTMKVVKL